MLFEIVYQPYPLYPLPLDKGKGKIIFLEGRSPSKAPYFLPQSRKRQSLSYITNSSSSLKERKIGL